MPRPPKDPSDRKTSEVRIPVTEEQKKIIADAAAEQGADVATWLRPIVLMAAEEQLSKQRKKSHR
jgi:uncharacterized protein (DUF1778 family)